MKVALYARVSTDQQTTENQTAILHDWATNRGWQVVRVYEEQEGAWRAGHQRQLAELFDAARQHKFDAVIVWALDRLTREGPAAILKMVDKLKGYRVSVLSYQESWTEAPGELGELLYAIVGWVARMESQRRSERIKAGIARRQAEGWKPGRPKGAKDRKKRQAPRVRELVSQE